MPRRTGRSSSLLVAALSIGAGLVTPAAAQQILDPDALAPTRPGQVGPADMTPCQVVIDVGEGHGPAGSTGIVPIRVTNVDPLVSGRLDITDTPDVLFATGCTSLVEGVACDVIESGGIVRLVFAGSLPPGDLVRFELLYAVDGAAAAGQVALVPSNLEAASDEPLAPCHVVGFPGTFDVTVCGNGAVEPGEGCDDGDTVAGDCCAGDCTLEPEGAPCDDGLFCTADACDGAGGCSAVPLDCTDGIDCTADLCDESRNLCVHHPSDAMCDDGLFCNGVESCDPGTGCSAGDPPVCDDGVGCTADACAEEIDACTSAAVCDDGVACTVDACDPVLDACVHEPADELCDDGGFCNGSETCDPAAGCQGGTPVDCADSVACTIDACKEFTNTCEHTPDSTSCQDGSFCNGAESCDPSAGCEPAAQPACLGGQCDEVDDTCFYPGAVPVGSTWGLVLLGVLLAAVGGWVFGVLRVR